MQLLEEWHIDVHVPKATGAEVAERLSGDVEAAVRRFADDLVHRLRHTYGLDGIEVRASR